MNAKDKKELASLAAQLVAKPTKEKAAPVVLSATLHRLVLADVKAFGALEKATGAEYTALVAIVKAAPYTDLPLFGALCEDLKTCYGMLHKDAAQIRINILNNARKIAHGAKVDGKWVAGAGMPALQGILDVTTSIRTLKPALQAAKPAAAKVKSGGARTSPKADKAPKAAKQEAGGHLVANDKKSALSAAMAILKQVEQFLSAGTDADTINAIEDCITALQLAA